MNIRVIVAHINGMGDFVPQPDKDLIAEAIWALSDTDKPETAEMRIMQASKCAANIGFLEAKWRAVQRRAKAQLVAGKANIARTTRESGIKRTENAISEIVDADPSTQSNEAVFIAAEEVADICQSLRYAIKNMIDGLLELSRSERLDRKLT